MPPQLGFGQLTLCRDTLQKAVRERWPSDSYDEKFRRTVVCSCLKQALVQGTKTPLLLNPLEIAKVEKDAAKADLLSEPLLDTLRGQRSSWWCRVIEKPEKPDQPQILPWLHDILKPASQEVAVILAKMPQLSQPSPPPGIPPGIAPHRRPAAKAGSDFTEVKDSATTPIPSEDFISRRTHGGTVDTPPVDEARQVLLDALADVWPGDDHTSVFASTAARICIQNGFVLGRNVPYELNAVHAPNMGTHLHKCGIGMVRGTLQAKIALPEVKPYYRMVTYPKNTPPNIMLLLANVFNGHPSDLVTDIVQQTFLVEPGLSTPLQYPATVISPALKARHHKPPASDHGSEASHSSYASATVQAAALEAPAPVLQMPAEPALPVFEARMKIQYAVAQGPACVNQNNSAAVVMRSIMFACLRDGFFLIGDAPSGDSRYAYKLHSAIVARVGEHARETMDSLGYAGQEMSDLLQSYEFRTYFKQFTYGTTACVRPVLQELVPHPDAITMRILQQTKLVDSPVLSAAEVPQSVPVPAARTETTQAPVPAPAAASQADDEESNASLRIKMVDSVDSASAAMEHIATCSSVTIGWGGFDVSKTGRIAVIQVLAAEVCYLFDAMVTDSIAQDAVNGALKELAENESILKITHDCGRLAALLHFHLSAGLRTVFDTQVAYQYMECVQALSDGNLLQDEPDLDITLEDLSDCYGVEYSEELAVMHPSQKIWAKRPLATFMQRYCKLLWDPVQLLADKMLSELGNLGQQAVLRLSKASSQRYLDLADREPVDNSGRAKAVLALNAFLPSFPVFKESGGKAGFISALALGDDNASSSGSGDIKAIAASHPGGQIPGHPEVKDVEDWSDTSSDRGDIKAHGTKTALPQAISYKAATTRHALP